MKTTLDIDDELLAQAKRYARQTRRSLGVVVEEGLRQVLHNDPFLRQYVLPDLSTGVNGAHYPLEDYSWQDMRDTIYGKASSPAVEIDSIAEESGS